MTEVAITKIDRSKNSIIIIGIDPGTRVTGYGIIELTGTQFRPIDFGCIRPPPNALLSDRYAIISESLEQLIEKFSPHEMAIETQFIHKNAQSALKLGIALGCALLAGKKRKMRVFGYSPREVKCAISGTGKASKEQVQNSVTRYLSLKMAPNPQDAADALAVAICHGNFPKSVLSQSKKEL
jgi:crossover junction endodeoxyribonuclease RuvC